MGKAIGIGLLAIVGVFAFVMVMWGFSTGFRYWTADIKGAVELREQTRGSGDFQHFSYDHFNTLCGSIQQAEIEYDTQYDLLQAMDPGSDRDSRARYDRQQRVVAVQKANIGQLKVGYNADSEKEQTLALFKDNDLPSRIIIVPHEYGNRTNCNFGG
jgi:hypothetical protein